MEVTNVLGEILLQSKVERAITSVDLSSQPKGIYFVRIIGGEQSLTRKIVKE